MPPRQLAGERNKLLRAWLDLVPGMDSTSRFRFLGRVKVFLARTSIKSGSRAAIFIAPVVVAANRAAAWGKSPGASGRGSVLCEEFNRSCQSDCSSVLFLRYLSLWNGFRVGRLLLLHRDMGNGFNYD